jgi:NTP pyrophosphatase (non-canonical NTP hydrolase)
MGTILVNYGDAADDHEGYAGQVLDDGSITATYSNETRPRMIGAVVAACGCGWQGTTRYPTTELFDTVAEERALAEWETQHAVPTLTRRSSSPTPHSSPALTVDKPVNLPEMAAQVAKQLRAHGFPAAGAVQRQVLALAEEAGEFVGAYRRWSGQARRTGTAADMRAELADVVITAYVTAHELNFDLDAAIADKLDVVFTRSWRESNR